MPHFVFSYSFLLALTKAKYIIYLQVTMHFLPVGHTHEDADQMFSCIAAALRRSNIYTLQGAVHDFTHFLQIMMWYKLNYLI